MSAILDFERCDGSYGLTTMLVFYFLSVNAFSGSLGGQKVSYSVGVSTDQEWFVTVSSVCDYQLHKIIGVLSQ